MSNSLPIRHIDSFCETTPTVYSNRGASGIDGIVHTALGVALGSCARCTLLVGDLAALHDLGALAALRKSSANLVVVVLNNQGGAIFKFLPIATSSFFDPFFTTPHEHDFRASAEGFGLPYQACSTREEFKVAYEQARRSGGPHILEVQTTIDDTHSGVAAVRQAAMLAAAPVAGRLADGAQEF